MKLSRSVRRSWILQKLIKRWPVLSLNIANSIKRNENQIKSILGRRGVGGW